jgi:dTDP-4-dehydrorhamnose 3,5-epimerase
MRFEKTEVAGAMAVHPEPRSDDRGWFARVFCAEEFAAHGLEADVTQTNVATTTQAGTVRGLHYQLPPVAEAKLIRCVAGSVFDVVVDLRPGSATFGRYAGVELSAGNAVAVYVPPGCAHGYQALTDGATVLYQVSAPYTPELERGIDHADPALGIAWPLSPINVSDKDRSLPRLAAAELPQAR